MTMEVPDPIELMEARMDRNIREFEKAQKDCPPGFTRCPWCEQLFDYEPIQSSPDPSSQGICYDCLSSDDKKAYDACFGK